MEETSIWRLRPGAISCALCACLAGLVFTGWNIHWCVADDDSDVPPQLLLMRNGSIVQGRILAKGEDYLVGLPHGQMFVPGNLVRASCRDLQEAYDLLRERAAAQSEAEAYITLAKWCAAQKLFDEARQSLETALNLDAGKDEARDLLVRTEELRRADELLRGAATAKKTEPAHRKSTVATESLAGLRPELALQFTGRIQPILTNNCSLAGCHGPRSETGFQLQRVAVGITPHRVAVERNLAQVLKHIDSERPADSPLLTVPRGRHGKGGKPVFGGPSGKDQIAELKRWVLDVAKEDLVQGGRNSPNAESSKLVQVGGEVSPRSAGFSAENPFGEAEAESPNRTTPSVKPAPKIRHGAEDADLFSPEAFNRARARRKQP